MERAQGCGGPCRPRRSGQTRRPQSCRRLHWAQGRRPCPYNAARCGIQRRVSSLSDLVVPTYSTPCSSAASVLDLDGRLMAHRGHEGPSTHAANAAATAAAAYLSENGRIKPTTEDESRGDFKKYYFIVHRESSKVYCSAAACAPRTVLSA